VQPELSAGTGSRTTFATGALWLVASNAAFSACQWATLVGLAKFGSVSTVGHFGLALAVVTPIVMVTGLSLKAVLATDVHRRFAFTDHLNLRLLVDLVAGGLVVLVSWAVGGPGAAVVVPVGIAKLAEATSETCYGLAQRHDRMVYVGCSKAVRGALGFGGLVATLAGGGSLTNGAWVLALVWIAFLVAVDLPVARTMEPILARSRAGTLWRLARESAPLGGVNGLMAVTDALPRYLLQLWSGAAAVGYFTALSSVAPALWQLAAAVGNAAAPRLGWAATGDAERFRRLVTRLLALAGIAGVALALGAAVVGRPFLVAAYAADYATHHAAFVVVMVGAGLGVANTIGYFALVASRQTRAQLAFHCVRFSVTAAAGALLVPTFGIMGAAVASALGTATLTVATARTLLGREATA